MSALGQALATELLAKLLASIEDPDGTGIGADIAGVDYGVRADVVLPSGDVCRVTVEWLGDREARARPVRSDSGYRVWVDKDRTYLFRLFGSGIAEIATRPSSAHIWGPPVKMEVA